MTAIEYTAAVEISGLRTTYRRGRVAVDSLDLTIERGRIHGFLGPNGSGKTTTIRALLGLIRPEAGSMKLLGVAVPSGLPTVIGRLGAVVESPQFFPHFSGRRNLLLLASVAGVKKRRVDEVLELVGLRDRCRDRVQSYSLGMRQRLAIAATLLKQPELLILDEPNNGLDPAGIREVRDLMRTLAANGTTVLLSSHILAEVQQVCDAVSIISQGRHVVTGPVSDVLAGGDAHAVRVRVDNLDYAASTLADAGLPVERRDDHLMVGDIADPSWITQTLARRRMFVSELARVTPDLESVFLELTGADAESSGAPLQVGEVRDPDERSGEALGAPLQVGEVRDPDERSGKAVGAAGVAESAPGGEAR